MFDEYFCAVTGLPCCGCSFFCEHRKKKSKGNVMNFAEAYREMLNGKKITHENFHGGYWAWENETIMIHCYDGRVLDIRQTEDTAFTFGFITEGKWSVMD